MNEEKNQKKKKILKVLVPIIAVIGTYFIYDTLFWIGTDNAQIHANTLILTARVSGYVTQVNAEEGQRVKAGDILVEIDAKDYQSKTKQSENELGSTEARAHDAELNYKRLQNLYEAGAVSLQQRDSAFATYQELARKLKAQKNQLELSEHGLTDTQIRAPSDGIIARRAAEVGMLANPGTPLLGFVSNQSRWVVANFKETDLSRLKVGQPVKIAVDAVTGKTYHGEVEAFYPATGAIFALLPPDNATGNFTKVVQRVPTRIKFLDLKPEDTDLLKAGLSVVVDVKVR
jgi:membrane fusion protein (multidrug efflux system)